MGTDVRRRILVGAAAAASVMGGALVTSPAEAATGWDDGAVLVPQGAVDESRPQLVVDSEGDRHVVYDDATGDVWLVEVDADGGVGSPRRLFDSGATDAGGYARIAIDDQDRMTVVWYVTDEAQDRRSHVEARSVAADGSLGSPQVLTPLAENAYYPEVVVDSTGVATVVWENQVGGGWPGRIQAVRLAPGSGTPLGPVADLDDPGGEVPDGIGVVDMTAAVDAADRVVVAWTRFDGDQEGNFRNATTRAVRLGADGTPGEVRAVSDDPSVDFRYPQIAVAPDGAVTIATTRFGDVAGTVATRLSAADFVPGPPVLVSDPERHSADDPVVTADAQGRVTVAWWAYGSDRVQLETRRIDASGVLEAERPVVGTKGPGFARMDLIAIGSHPDGAVTVAWPGADGRTGGRVRMHAVRLAPTDGAPSTTRRLSSPGGADAFSEVIDLAVDPDGRATVVWTRYGATAVRRSAPSSAEPVPADTLLLGGPRGGEVVRDRTPRFRFEGDTLEATFRCRLDGRRWSPCTSPLTTRKLGTGRHRLEVRAVDADGTRPDPTPAVARFRVR